MRDGWRSWLGKRGSLRSTTVFREWLFKGTDKMQSLPTSKCSVPPKVGQPFVLFRLLVCIVVGGIGLGRGI